MLGPVGGSWGPNLERLWQSVAPGRLLNRKKVILIMRLGIIRLHGLTRDMTRQ